MTKTEMVCKALSYAWDAKSEIVVLLLACVGLKKWRTQKNTERKADLALELSSLLTNEIYQIERIIKDVKSEVLYTANVWYELISDERKSINTTFLKFAEGIENGFSMYKIFNYCDLVNINKRDLEVENEYTRKHVNKFISKLPSKNSGVFDTLYATAYLKENVIPNLELQKENLLDIQNRARELALYKE